MKTKGYKVAILVRKTLLFVAIILFLLFFYLFTLAFSQIEKMELKSNRLTEKYIESQKTVDQLLEKFTTLQNEFRRYSTSKNKLYLTEYKNELKNIDNYLDSIITLRKHYIDNNDLGYIGIEHHIKVLNSYIITKDKINQIKTIYNNFENSKIKEEQLPSNELKTFIESNFALLHEINLIINKLNRDRFEVRKETTSAEKKIIFDDAKKIKLLTILSISFMFVLICIIIYYQYFTSIYISELNNQKKYAKKLADKNANILSQITHEIRTPINALIGILDLFKKKVNFNDQKNKTLIESAYTNIINTSKTINEILELRTFKLQENKFSHFDIETLFKKIIHLYDSQAKIKNISIECILKENTPTIIYSDKAKIKQIINNILSNAIKFSEKGIISCEIKIISESVLQISIKDEGIGMSDSIQNNIYKKYYTAEDNNKYSNGIGLGLYVTKKIIDSLHGSIRINSILKSGTIFIIDIPIPIPSYRQHEEKKEKLINNLSPSISWLLIDDNALNLFYIRQFFNHFQHVRTAKNGLEGLEILEKENIDIIITDINMPVMTGDELLVKIRQQERFNEIKIIATSSDNAQIKNLEEQHNYYFDGILIKPFDEKILTEIIYKTLKNE